MNPNFKHGKTSGVHISGWSVLEKGEDCCRNCGSTYILHLHHAIPRSKWSLGRRDLRNGLPLCAKCHKGWHMHTLTIYRDVFTVDEWEFVCSAQLIGQRTEAWLDDHYPPREAS